MGKMKKERGERLSFSLFPFSSVFRVLRFCQLRGHNCELRAKEDLAC
jgi:hypothetical protein